MNTAAPSPPRAGLAHFPALDGLRAIAVLLVLYNHAPILLGHGDGSDGGIWHGSKGAWIGVDLFFVLSGFLITTILLRARGRPGAFRRFWVRRALRIFPLAYAYLGSLALVAWCVPGFVQLRDGESFLWASVYMLNLHVAEHGWSEPEFGLLWSLAVEEHFYLLWPMCALCARRVTVAAILVAAVVGTPLVRWWLLARLGQVGIYVVTWCRWDTLAFGALLALAWDSPWRARIRAAAMWLALPATLCVAWVVGTPMSAVAKDVAVAFQVAGYSAIAASFACWCALAIDPPRLLAAVLGNASLRYVGRISYGLYVWHVLTAHLTPRILKHLHLELDLTGRVLAWLVVLFTVASVSYRWFEAPLLRLKDRIAG